jgi:hypothetical protein
VKIREKISFTLLISFYLLVSLRYFPGQWVRTIQETLLHLLMIAPYTVGFTILIATVLRRLSDGHKPPWPVLIRIFITVSILLEFLLGINDYIS